ncbi:MAG: hypothetical protein D6704_11940 [Nitrospirae bacterium]|nr:MAG: hypothetical protein D6704_11940 [Nitrospirota bacterium]
MSTALIYRELQLGRDYWIEDQILPNPLDVARRCVSKSTWILGSPWRPEPWPGMRAPHALTDEELHHVEECVKRGLGLRTLQPQSDTERGLSGHNHVQLVGGAEGVARPHVDSAKICDYAAVLYLHPCPPTSHCGTSFYRLHLPGQEPGGNVCPKEYESLSDVPGLAKEMDPTMFEEILEVPYVFNRLLAYKADIIHSATAYFGWTYELASKRMAVVFFWKGEPA